MGREMGAAGHFSLGNYLGCHSISSGLALIVAIYSDHFGMYSGYFMPLLDRNSSRENTGNAGQRRGMTCDKGY